jgi:hypothetical protein
MRFILFGKSRTSRIIKRFGKEKKKEKKKRREDSHYREMLSLQNILQKKSITN